MEEKQPQKITVILGGGVLRAQPVNNDYETLGRVIDIIHSRLSVNSIFDSP